MLADMVQRGVLPPVEQRLPTTPCVLPALEGVHKYDSLIRRAYKGVSDAWGPQKMRDHAFVWYDVNLNLVPRLCESWEVNGDASEWTFNLRPGTRWSDGAAFTSDDISWWYQYVLSDARLSPITPEKWQTGGQLMTIEVPDTTTVIFKFSQPKVMFISGLPRESSCLCPSHYMKRYHIDFVSNPSALEAEAMAAGYGSWSDYYNQNRNVWESNPARPDLGPWLAKNAIGQTLFEMERNPYYYCVDTENNQLPYVDSIVHRLFNLDSEMNDWVKSGEIDFQARHISYSYYADFKAHETTGGYQVKLGISGVHLAIALNLTTQTPRLRTFFQERKVRTALSLAVNRGTMNSSLYNDLATPRQYSPISTSPEYYSTLSNAYISYDVAQANDLLDQAGYTQKDIQGFRLWNDSSGERISFTVEGYSQSGTAEEAAVQQIIQYYAAVGIQATYQYVDRNTYNEHINRNEIEAAWNGADRSILPLQADATIFRGTMNDRPWACAWALWYADPNDPNGEEPPAGHWIRDIWNLWDQIVVEPNSAQREVLFDQIMDIWASELPMIGYLGELPAVAIVKNNLHNFIAGFPMDDTTSDEEIFNPETYSWDSILTPSITINYTSGSPGSFFTIVGTDYPPNSTAVISVNGQAVETLFTDDSGGFEFVLDTAQASTGFYEITVKVNPEASTTFELTAAGEQHPKESEAVLVTVPSGIASHYVYIPNVRR